MKRFLILVISLISFVTIAQTKVSGYVLDEFNEPISFANVIFKNSSKGTITNENGKFYMEDDVNWDTLVISFVGYLAQEITLKKCIIRSSIS